MLIVKPKSENFWCIDTRQRCTVQSSKLLSERDLRLGLSSNASDFDEFGKQEGIVRVLQLPVRNTFWTEMRHSRVQGFERSKLACVKS